MIGSGNSSAITLLEILRRKTPVIESLYWTSFPTPKPVSTSTISASMSKHPEPRTVLSVKPARHQLRLRRWQAGVKSGLAGHCLFIKNICGQIKLLYHILKCICQNKCLFAVRFNGVRFTGLRIIKFGMSPFSCHISNAEPFKYLYYLP